MTYTRTAILPITPDEAFALVTEPERLRRWQAVTAQVDLRAGGAYRWTVTPGNVARGTVREVEPGKRVVLGFGWEDMGDLKPDQSTVTITIEPVEGGTAVTLTHEGLTEAQEVGHAEGWDHFLDRLERLAVTGDAGPDEWAAAPENLDEFSAAEATLAVLQPVLRGLTAEDRARRTPCEEYDGHALAEHLIGSIIGLGTLAGATMTDPGEGPLEDRVSVLATQAIEGWRARGVDGVVATPGGDVPASVIAGIMSIEFLIHGWDFAQTSGQDLTVSDEVVAWVAERSEQLAPSLRERGEYAAEQFVDRDASPLDRLVARSGRRPAARV